MLPAAFKHIRRLFEEDNLVISAKKIGFAVLNSVAKRLLEEQLPEHGPKIHDGMRDLGVKGLLRLCSTTSVTMGGKRILLKNGPSQYIMVTPHSKLTCKNPGTTSKLNSKERNRVTESTASMHGPYCKKFRGLWIGNYGAN